MHHLPLTLVAALLGTAALQARDVLPPARERYRGAAAEETPDFQRHLLPLLGRLGCNGRACHGSFQGQGGFRLSLFGYDFDRDHAAISPRLQEDLLLWKPSLEVAHRGGRRLTADTWQYHLVRRWIVGGAKNSSSSRLTRLEVSPGELRLQRPGSQHSLRVIAHWADGQREDVTCLSRFQSNDEAVATVDPEGVVTARGLGASHIVASYDNGVQSVPVLLPVSDHVGARFPDVPTPTRIDELVVAQCRTLGLVPSPPCDDLTFLRRVSLDLTGTLPTPREVERFLTDDRPDRRTRLIDALLETPAYAAWWTHRLCDLTGNAPNAQGDALGLESTRRWYAWLFQRVAANRPYDEIVADIVLATSRRPGQSYRDFANEMTACYRADDPASFAKLPQLTLYWSRRGLARAEDKALAFAHSFLGLRLQCAQCHKHPFDRWTKDDFQQFTRFFEPIQYGVSSDALAEYRQLSQTVGRPEREPNITLELLAKVQPGGALPWREVFVQPAPARALRLFGTPVQINANEDPRRPLLAWLRAPDNPYFARAWVNRVWANYFGVGLVEPTDDQNLANPASNPALLDYLTRDFIAQRFDMKRLHRQIVVSLTYQRSWRPNDTNAGDRRQLSRAVPRRLHAEVIYDALAQAVAADDDLLDVRNKLERRAIAHVGSTMAGTYTFRVFGKPDRNQNCDCDRSNRPTLLQSLFLQNDPVVNSRLDDSGWLKQWQGKALPRDRVIRQAFLRTLSRPPSERERQRAHAHFTEAKDEHLALRELLWALINTKEFVLNH